MVLHSIFHTHVSVYASLMKPWIIHQSWYTLSNVLSKHNLLLNGKCVCQSSIGIYYFCQKINPQLHTNKRSDSDIIPMSFIRKMFSFYLDNLLSINKATIFSYPKSYGINLEEYEIPIRKKLLFLIFKESIRVTSFVSI